MDNLQVHKTKEVLETCERLKVRQIFNVPYIHSPGFKGIEKYLTSQGRVKEARPGETHQGHKGIQLEYDSADHS